MSLGISHHLRRSLVALAVAGALAPQPGEARPKAFKPALAVSNAGSTFLALSVTGSEFGAPAPGSFVDVSGVAGTQLVSLSIPSTDANVVAWRDEQVVVKAQPDLTRVRMRVRTPSGQTSMVRADHYAFDWFDTSAALGVNVGPGHIAVDPAGRVWINGEFHPGVAYFDPSTAVVKPAYWPRIPVPAFKTCVGSCVPTTLSGGGEDAIVDSKGRVWLPEGGGGNIAPRNHSRIIGYDAAAQKVLVYNLPGDQNGLVGVAWDQRRNRLWYTQAYLAGVRPPRLTSFDPDHPAIPREEFSWDFATLPSCSGGVCSDNPTRSCATFRDCMIASFTFTTSATCTAGTCSNAPYHQCQTVEDCVLAEHICPPGADDGGCFHDYPMPGLDNAHVAVSPRDGSVWNANYGFAGTTISRLDPATGDVTVHPLAPAPFNPPQVTFTSIEHLIDAIGAFTNWPWEVKIASNGDIVVGEYGLTRIARFRASRVGSPACQTLVPPRGSSGSCTPGPVGPTFPQTIELQDSGCTNPCIVQRLVPAAWEPGATVPGYTHRLVAGDMKTLAIDRKKNVWFKHGYFVKGKRDIVRLPPLLWLYPSSFWAGSPPDLHSALGDGVAINVQSGEIFGFDWFGRRLIRLRKLS